MPEVRHLTRPKPSVAIIDLGDDDTVTITFDRNKVTPAWVVETEQREAERSAALLASALADVILDWDVTADGQPYPPTADNLTVFSYATLGEILQAIMRGSVPSRAEGNASSSPASTPSSDSTLPQPTSQNGLATSPSPALSASPSPT